MKKYAGIGTRQPPKEVARIATKLSKFLKQREYVLRTGGAEGMDTAFYTGAYPMVEVFFPTSSKMRSYCRGEEILCHSDIPQEAFQIVKEEHPAWNRLSDYVKRLHARNVQILLGKDLDDPVDFVVFYTTNMHRGGTAFGLKLASRFGITTVGLTDSRVVAKIKEVINNDSYHRRIVS